ncbi:hypothetical protein FKM82_001819 [Ascaphus truei]
MQVCTYLNPFPALQCFAGHCSTEGVKNTFFSAFSTIRNNRFSPARRVLYPVSLGTGLSTYVCKQWYYSWMMHVLTPALPERPV